MMLKPSTNLPLTSGQGRARPAEGRAGGEERETQRAGAAGREEGAGEAGEREGEAGVVEKHAIRIFMTNC